MPSVFVTAGLNVAYVYAIAFRHHDRAVLVFLFRESDQTIAVLKVAGRQAVDAERLEALVG